MRKTHIIGDIDTGHATRAVVKVDIEREGERVSFQADAKRPRASDIDAGGQMQDTLRELAERDGIAYRPGWNRDRLIRLLDLWDEWHLNDMRPECEHQRAAGWVELAQQPLTLYHWRRSPEATRQVSDALKDAQRRLIAGETITLEPDLRAIAALPAETTTESDTPPGPLYEPNTPRYENDHYNKPSETKTAGWVRPSEHSGGLLGKPCPVCGYGYGTEWKTKPLTPEAIAAIESV